MVHKAQRGLFELRQGRAVCVTTAAPTGYAVVAAVEALDDACLAQLRSFGGPLRLVVTRHRGQAMGLGDGEPEANLSIGLTPDATPETVLELATAAGLTLSDTTSGLEVRPAADVESAGLALTHFGRLLPALVSVTTASDDPRVRSWLADGTILAVSDAEIAEAVAHREIEITRVAEAPVPLADAEQSRFVFFREGGGFIEHVAVLIGDRERWPDPVPVRLHSACLTGDLFGSLRCDCGEQLHGSLRHFNRQGGGVLVYLAQEGRGIGLGNKIRAYNLQEDGFDTVDADALLGFGADERRYDAAVAILRHLGIDSVELLTNNPDKVSAVEKGGIRVAQRTPLFGRLNRHNLRYVQAKVDRSGHWLMDMISQPMPGD